MDLFMEVVSVGDRDAAADVKAGVQDGFVGFEDDAEWRVRVVWIFERDAYQVRYKRQGMGDRTATAMPDPTPAFLTMETTTNVPGGIRTAMAQYVRAYLARVRASGGRRP